MKHSTLNTQHSTLNTHKKPKQGTESIPRRRDPTTSFVFERDCTCDNERTFCDSCGVEFTLDVSYDEVMDRRRRLEGGGDDDDDFEDEKVIVTSADLKTDHPFVRVGNFLNTAEEVSPQKRQRSVKGASKEHQRSVKGAEFVT